MLETERAIPDAEHEPTDIGPGFIWGAVAVCLATLLACALLVFWLYPQSSLDLTLQMPLPLYPEPRLQPDPTEDLQRLEAREMQILNGRGRVDQERAAVHIPIAQAMREVAREGIAGWPRAPEDRP
ncbi:MAG TPA: hypothetical protein VGL87_08525 [Steroidobacteraceae bacterium]|jgi:hypothetical protein